MFREDFLVLHDSNVYAFSLPTSSFLFEFTWESKRFELSLTAMQALSLSCTYVSSLQASLQHCSFDFQQLQSEVDKPITTLIYNLNTLGPTPIGTHIFQRCACFMSQT